MAKFMASDPGYARRVKWRFEFPDYKPYELAQMFMDKVTSLGRGVDGPVTIEKVAELIASSTDQTFRSAQNGSVAEDMLHETDSAMDARGPDYAQPTLIYTLDDVRTSALRLRERAGLTVST